MACAARRDLTLAGVAFAVWARMLLAGNWSSDVTLKRDHELIVNGPYALVRHPIYTGILLALIGTALAIGEWRAALAVVLVTLAFSQTASRGGLHAP